jgi:hypothetical protein
MGLKQEFPETRRCPRLTAGIGLVPVLGGTADSCEKAKDGRIGAPAKHTTGKAFEATKVQAEKYRFMRSVGLFGVEPAIEPRAERAAQPPFLSIHRRPGTSNNGR